MQASRKENEAFKTCPQSVSFPFSPHPSLLTPSIVTQVKVKVKILDEPQISFLDDTSPCAENFSAMQEHCPPEKLFAIFHPPLFPTCRFADLTICR